MAKLEEGTLTLADGTWVSFDKLILAPGSRYPKFQAAKPWDQTSLEGRKAYNQAEFVRFQVA